MKNYFAEIDERLKKQIPIEELIIVDNSREHEKNWKNNNA